MVSELEEFKIDDEEKNEEHHKSFFDDVSTPTVISDKDNLKNKLFNDVWKTINKSISENRVNDEMYLRILSSFLQLMNMLEDENKLNQHAIKELKQYRTALENNYGNSMSFQDGVLEDLRHKYRIESINSKELSKISMTMTTMQDQISKLSAKNSQSVTLDQKNEQHTSRSNIRTKPTTGKSLYTFLSLCGIGSLTLMATIPFPINIILSIIAGSPILLAIISKLRS